MTIDFLRGALTLATFIAGLFFLRFWRLTGERLFLMFSLAFWVFTIEWLALAIISPVHESRHYLFVFRLVGFLLIIAGVIDKNRSAKRSSTPRE